MTLHEHQAKRLLSDAGIPVPRHALASSPAQAAEAYTTLRGRATDARCVLKAQIHAGGRGKAGGVVTVSSAEEASRLAGKLLGTRLVTAQTGPEGLPVSAVLVEEETEVAQEWYLGMTVDRFQAKPVILASRRGGVDIEEVAAQDPQAMIREPIEIGQGLGPGQGTRIAKALGCAGTQAEACAGIVAALWTLCHTQDATLVEINPLVTDPQGRLLALDAKVIVDDNALFRHPGLAAWRDPSQEHPIEYQASQIGISYVGLHGAIGCLVNGAGLAMATNDVLTLFGGEPANFLDVGGGANVEQITKAFSIILSDARVKVILVNIFGGIMRCDWVAQGLLKATETLRVNVPIVVRLQGTKVAEGRALLQQAARLNLTSLETLSDAARKSVELARA